MNKLNPRQHEAVRYADGPLLVLAGAGSGKTSVITRKIAYLIEELGIPGRHIAAVTFTNKAAREMKERVGRIVDRGKTRGLIVSTFHNLGLNMIREEHTHLGYHPGFSIFDAEDAKALLQDLMMREASAEAGDELNDVQMTISSWKNAMRSPAEAYSKAADEREQRIAIVYKHYNEYLKAYNAVDFDDLILLPVQLFRDNPEVLAKWRRKIRYMLVDEYQDTNRLQAELIDLLGARHKNVMVVGDDSQSIYSWRGANFKNILEFPKRYPGTEVYKIEVNYRSTPQILDLANAAIAVNTQQFSKELEAAREPGEKPAIVACGAADEQAAFIAQRALELREEGTELNDMVVLYRSHFHALEMQLELTRRNIPFSITSGIRFFEQAHIKDVTAYLKWLANLRDELAFKRLTLMLPGVGGKTAAKLWESFLEHHADGRLLAECLQKCAGVPKKAVVAWAQFSATIAQLEDDSVHGDAGAMLDLIVEAGYEDYVAANYDKVHARLDDIEQLGVFARQYDSLETFLAELALLTNIEAEEERPADDDQEQLRLSTIHQAKGLEFKVVFVIMLCDGMFPSNRSLDSVEGEEEERRLFYVAITRAKDELYLSYPMIRAVAAGSSADMMQQPSRFLGELPAELVAEWNLQSFDPYGE